MDGRSRVCPHFHRAIELIGRRWTGAIVFVLLQGRERFAGLRSAIPEMTDRMLSERLRELESEGLVDRTVASERPIRVEYSLTERGRALAEAVSALAEWSHEWLADSNDCPPGCGDCPPAGAIAGEVPEAGSGDGLLADRHET